MASGGGPMGRTCPLGVLTAKVDTYQAWT